MCCTNISIVIIDFMFCGIGVCGNDEVYKVLILFIFSEITLLNMYCVNLVNFFFVQHKSYIKK